MKIPSGAILDSFDLKILMLMRDYGFVRYSEKPFSLKSGIESHVYVYGREDLTDHPDLEWLIGLKIAQVVVNAHQTGDRAPCLIGIPTAGTALAQAAAMAAYKEGIESPGGKICHRIMREGLKTHGVHRTWVNGDPSPEHTYWTVDNVITDGQSKFEAAEKLYESGYPISKMPSLIFVDRQQGGLKRIREQGFSRIITVYNLLDISFALGKLKCWPNRVVKDVETEIKAHQFV